MQLTESQQARVLEKLRPLWKNHHCEVCGQEDWAYADELHQLSGYSGPPLAAGVPPAVGTAVVPLVVAFCTHCGSMRAFNAIALGLIDHRTGGWIAD